jgi:uncharacterized membrane protein YhhN
MNKQTYIKVALSASLVILAFIAALTQRTPYALLVLPGMLLGFHGDLCLAKIPFFERIYKNSFIVGAASFLVGHLFYIAAFVSAMNIVPWSTLWLALLAYALPALLAGRLALRGADAPLAMRVGLLFYALTIAVMASFGMALGAARGGKLWLAALGGLLFVVSDGLIALREFATVKLPYADALVWITYVPAQFLIIVVGFFA